MAEICKATLGDTAYLFWEQYVVKEPETGGSFSWHQDSGYLSYLNNKPFLTCWRALDDMNQANGAITSQAMRRVHKHNILANQLWLPMAKV